MMNRPFTILTLLALLLAASCSKDMSLVGSYGNGQAISFSAYAATAPTKGESCDLPYLFGKWVDSTSTFEPGAGIGIFAFYQKAKKNGYAEDFTKYTGEPTYMYNQKVERTTTDGVSYIFNYDPVKFWPNNQNDQLSFFAYGPFDETFAWEDLKLESNLKGTKVSREYVIEDNVEDMTDYIWADPVMNAKNTDVAGNVQFNFIHLCSRLSFSSVVNLSGTSIYVTVDKISVKGKFTTSGTLEYYPESGTHTWRYLEGSDRNHTYVPFTASYGLDPESGQTVLHTFEVDTIERYIPETGGFIFVLPGTQDIEVTATVSQRSRTTGFVKTFDFVNTFPAMELKENKAYNFQLKITLNPVNFTGQVATWEATTEPYTAN